MQGDNVLLHNQFRTNWGQECCGAMCLTGFRACHALIRFIDFVRPSAVRNDHV